MGELLGTRQHGLPAFRVADLARDLEIVRAAQKDAAEIIRDDPSLRHPDWQRVRGALQAAYGGRLAYLDAG
jgi:ATP-dependent DNA helicase RecG